MRVVELLVAGKTSLCDRDSGTGRLVGLLLSKLSGQDGVSVPTKGIAPKVQRLWNLGPLYVTSGSTGDGS